MERRGKDTRGKHEGRRERRKIREERVHVEKVTVVSHCRCGLRALHKHNETRLSVGLSDLRVG